MPESYQTPPPDQEESPRSIAILAVARSWSVLPIIHREKKPQKGVGWQYASIDQKQVDEWCAKWPDTGFGVLTGRRSGVAVLDLDSDSSIEWWNQQQSEHGPVITPTAQTSRGLHVYFRVPRDVPCPSMNLRRLPAAIEAEFKADKSLVILPGSIHESGFRYRWKISPRDANLAAVPQFLESVLGAGCYTEQCCITDGRLSPCCITPLIADLIGPGEVEAVVTRVSVAMAETLPRRFRTRNSCLFKLARHLKGIQPLSGVPATHLNPLISLWHEIALPNITTKDPKESMNDFAIAWSRVVFSAGTTIGALLREPAEVPEQATARTRLYSCLCQLLAAMQVEAGAGKPFFLSANMGAKSMMAKYGLKVEMMQVYRCMCSMRQTGILKLVHSYRPEERKANWYEWLGTLPAK